MAKASDKAVALNDIYEGLSPEEVAEMLALTGQAANTSYEKAPVLKVNLCGKADKDGGKVDLGNFVLNQSIKVVDGKKVIEYIGKDFGATPTITVIKVAQQYNYYNDAKDQRCSSQLITEANEVAVGYNLKKNCAGGTCPRRVKDIDKKERCTCQYVVYVEAGPDKDKCLMYFKGSSFMPFKEYLDSVKPDPILFFPTTLTTKEKTMGTVDYYEVYPIIDKTVPFDAATRKENMEKLRAISKDITGYKAQQSASTKQVEYKKKEVTEAEDAEFDDIAF